MNLIDSWPEGITGWNCKPHVLMQLLQQGIEDVVWIDSDVLLSSGCVALFQHLDSSTIVVTEEAASIPNQGSELRTVGWKLRVGRRFPRTINSCVLRVTAEHATLLTKWAEMLDNAEYLDEQKRPSNKRRPEFGGDQDALNALLGSDAFSEIKVMCLSSKNVIHTGGARTYSLSQRLLNLFRPKPTFVHSSGPKPWIVLSSTHGKDFKGRFWTIQRLVLETSAYTALARRYRAAISDQLDWMNYSSLLGRVFKALSFGHPSLQGLPLTLIASTMFQISSLTSGKETATEQAHR